MGGVLWEACLVGGDGWITFVVGDSRCDRASVGSYDEIGFDVGFLM